MPRRLPVILCLILLAGSAPAATAEDETLDLLVRWSRKCEREVLSRGFPLTPAQQTMAARLGVAHPARVRVRVVPVIPGPTDPALAKVVAQKGLADGNTVGLTFGHAIYLRADRSDDPALLRHELTHVAQYERLGAKGFLARYADELERLGYDGCLLEAEARRAEVLP